MSKARPLVAIESPFKGKDVGDVRRNRVFAQNVCRYAVLEGYNPYAMHLFFTQFLKDGDAEERKLGINCGLAWTGHADEAWFCLRRDERPTAGMKLALDDHRRRIAHGARCTLKFLVFSQGGKLLGTFDEPE